MNKVIQGRPSVTVVLTRHFRHNFVIRRHHRGVSVFHNILLTCRRGVAVTSDHIGRKITVCFGRGRVTNTDRAFQRARRVIRVLLNNSKRTYHSTSRRKSVTKDRSKSTKVELTQR